MWSGQESNLRCLSASDPSNLRSSTELPETDIASDAVHGTRPNKSNGSKARRRHNTGQTLNKLNYQRRVRSADQSHVESFRTNGPHSGPYVSLNVPFVHTIDSVTSPPSCFSVSIRTSKNLWMSSTCVWACSDKPVERNEPDPATAIGSIS